MGAIENILEYLTKKYTKYGISKKVIRDYIESIDNTIDDERICRNKVSILIDSYIIRRLQEGEELQYIHYIKDDYEYLKKIIKGNKSVIKYIEELSNKDSISIDEHINNIYEKSIEIIIKGGYDYNYEKLLSENILNSVKSYITRPINSIDVQVDDKRSYDISCLQILLRTSYISINKLSEHTKIDSTKLYQYIYLNKPISGYEFAKILEHFNTPSYDKFIDFVINYEENLPRSKKIAQFKTIIEESITRNKYYSNINLTNNIKVDVKEQKDENSKKVKKRKYTLKGEWYDISFLNNWVIKNRIIKQRLSSYLGKSIARLVDYLSGELAPKEVVDKLIELFGVKDYEELKTKALDNELKVPQKLTKPKKRNGKEKRYNISFLNPWLKENNFSIQILSEHLNINYRNLVSYINGYNNAPEEVVNQLAKLFGTKNYEELLENTLTNKLIIPKELLEESKRRRELKGLKKSDDRYDISFLSPLIQENNISQRTLASYLEISQTSVSKYLLGKILAPKEVVDKLIKLFKVTDYDELKTKAINNELEVPEELLEEREERSDISFLSPWLNSNNILKQDLANYLGKSAPCLANYLNGKFNAPKWVVDKLIELFGVKDYEELKRKIINNEFIDSKVILNRIYIIITVLNIQKVIDFNYMLSIIDLNTISKLDYYIISLLFSEIKVDGKVHYCTVVSISNIFKIDVKYVYNVFINCLELYKKSFENNKKYEYKN